MHARFFYDIVCPYAYLASTQIQTLAQETGVEIEWVPMLLGGVFRAHNAPQVPAEHMSPAKARMNTLDLDRWSTRWEVPFRFSPHHPQRTVEVMRLLCVTPPQQRPEVSASLFRAYWVEGRKLDGDLIDEVATMHHLTEQWQSRREEAKQILFENTELAVSFGVFGAPALEVKGEIFWGQDRLELARKALGGEPQLLSSTPKQAPQGSYVEIFHDFSSPFSYLGCQQVEKLITTRGAEVRWRPMLLGALFKAVGAPIVPLFEMSAAKRAYMGKDLQDWASYWGVELTFPEGFPINTVTALRLALIEPSLTPILYQAAWRDGQNIGNIEVLSKVINQAGFDAHSLIEQTQTPTIKEELRLNTEAAEAYGAFGAPSYVLHRPGETSQLFWGQDRLSLLCEALTTTK